MQDLSVIHKNKLIHRDISPDNLIIGTDNHLHLIDFGAASHEDITRAQHTVILKSGYAPPEQYISNSKAGAWIDVYALCATMYFALTGKPPSEAIERLEQDSLYFPDTLTDILPWQKAALEKGLHINMSRRFRNMDELYDAITSAPEPETQVTITGISLTKKEKKKIRNMRYRLKIPLLFSLLLFLSACVFLITYATNKRQVSPRKTAAESTIPITNSKALETFKPPNLLSMPKLSGLTLKKAKKMLKNLDDDIHIETTYVYNKKIKKGQVISQNIAEGTLFSSGYFPDILLTISLGKKQTEQPDKNNSKKPKETKKTEESQKAAETAVPKTTPEPTEPPKPENTPKKSR